MKIVAATNNGGKVREMRGILSPLGFEIIPMHEAGIDARVEETGATFEENSLIKARAVALLCDYPVIADDSGLCIDALNGRPGVYSARYAGEGASDEDKIKKILSELEGKENRAARFICAVSYVGSDGKEITAKGSVEGTILEEPQGSNGFGYDPVFFCNEIGKCFALADDDEKNSVSHRGRALRRMAQLLENSGR